MKLRFLIPLFISVLTLGCIMEDPAQPLPSNETTNQIISARYTNCDTFSHYVFTLKSDVNTLNVEFVLDPSYEDSDNFRNIIQVMNETYLEAGIGFRCEQVLETDIPLISYNLRRAALMPYRGDRPNSDIIVYVTGKHKDDIIGQAVYNGYFYDNSNIVYVDLMNMNSLQGKANMISHEIGHLLGLDHCEEGSLMQPLSSELYVSFSKSDLNYLTNLRL